VSVTFYEPDFGYARAQCRGRVLQAAGAGIIVRTCDVVRFDDERGTSGHFEYARRQSAVSRRTFCRMPRRSAAATLRRVFDNDTNVPSVTSRGISR